MTPIQFGITVFFHDYREFALLRTVAREAPFLTHVEFRAEYPFLVAGSTPDEQIDFFRDVLRDGGLRSTFHSTMFDINLATLNPWMREAAVACYRTSIDVAERLGSEVIVVHGGSIEPEFTRERHEGRLLEMARTHLCQSLHELAEYGAPRGVRVAVENLPPDSAVNIIHDVDSHLDIVRRVDHPNLGAIYDMAHAFLYGQDVLAYLDAIRPVLFEIHAHNNHGEADDHLGLHHGKMDYAAVLDHPGGIPDVPFIMELKSREEIAGTFEWIGAHLAARAGS